MNGRRRVRLGFIGAGAWAIENHMPILAARDDVEMVAVARRNPIALAEVQRVFGFERAFSDPADLLALDLDGVVVSSPNDLHYAHSLAALNRGMHVLCEKPMALSADNAWALVNAAATKGRHLVVPYGWQYKSYSRAARDIVHRGGLGPIRLAVCHMASPTASLFGIVPRQRSTSIREPAPETWQSIEHGGGYAHGQITHSSALLFWMTGLQAARVTSRSLPGPTGVDLYDAASIEFTNGAIGTISGAGSLPDGDPFQLDIRLFGDDGVLLFDVERGRVVHRRLDGENESPSVDVAAGDYSCDEPPNAFVELIKGRGLNESPGSIAARSVELIDAMHRSAALGGVPVDVEIDSRVL